jgi:8-oxo-dGTP diphosphatase
VDLALATLRKRFGKVPLLQPALAAADFAPVRGGRRRAEVAMAIRRPAGTILLQTKAFYPPGTFRLPTGGIKAGEDVEHALLREVHEETNLAVDVDSVLAVLDYSGPEGIVVFRTYLFLLREVSGELRVNDPDEQISGWLEADGAALREAAHRLRGLDGTWKPWGAFRAIPLDILLQTGRIVDTKN